MIKNKVYNFIKRYQAILSDILLNTLAFGLYTLAQQVLLLPILAKKVEMDIYADIIILILIINIVSNVFGGQLGVVRQIRDTDYEDKSDLNDFSILMICSSIIILTGTGLFFALSEYDVYLFIIVSFLILATNYRFYLRAIFRLEDKYVKLIYQNSTYFVGIITGLILMNFYPMPLLPLILGEAFALLYSIFNITRVTLKLKKSLNFKTTLNDYLGLSMASVFTNSVTFVDRMLTYPLLGASSLAVYNAGSTVAKISAFIINPLNDVVLVQLSKSRNRGNTNIIKNVIKGSVLIVIILSILTIPIIYALLLYCIHSLDEITSIIIGLSISFSIGTATHIMKSFVLKYAKPSKLSVVYLINLISMALLGLIGANFYGLKGFTIAIVLVRLQLWILFVFLLKNSMKEVVGRYEYDND